MVRESRCRPRQRRHNSRGPFRSRRPADGGRKAHNETRAETLALAALVERAETVLGADGAAVGFDDLARDGEAKAGVLAEARLRPVGIEALENALQRVRRDAGPVVVGDDLDVLADAA